MSDGSSHHTARVDRGAGTGFWCLQVVYSPPCLQVPLAGVLRARLAAPLWCMLGLQAHTSACIWRDSYAVAGANVFKQTAADPTNTPHHSTLQPHPTFFSWSVFSVRPVDRVCPYVLCSVSFYYVIKKLFCGTSRCNACVRSRPSL